MNDTRGPDDIWVLGGTGRTGMDIAWLVADAGAPVVLVGRDPDRLTASALKIGPHTRTVVAADPAAMAAAIRTAQPAVVVNTVGPFATTAALIAQACLPTTSYLDLSNDFVAATAIFALHEEAVRAECTLVPGAGFGVLATEAVVVALCRGKPTPDRIRVDALPSLATQDGALGEALARTIVEGIPEGNRTYQHGRLVRTGAAGSPARVHTPDGVTATTVGWPSGDLVAAQRVSGAANVVAATSEIPANLGTQLGFPIAGIVLRVRPIRELAVRRVSSIRLRAAPRPRQHSWGHAVVTWPNGTQHEGWMRANDASEFTAAAAAAVAVRLAHGQGAAGSHSPAALFGDDLIREAGGELLIDSTVE